MKLEFENEKVLNLFRDAVRPLEVFVVDKSDRVVIRQGSNIFNIMKHSKVNRGSSVQ